MPTMRFDEAVGRAGNDLPLSERHHSVRAKHGLKARAGFLRAAQQFFHLGKVQSGAAFGGRLIRQFVKIEYFGEP